MEDHFLSVNSILNKASERISFDRVRFSEKNTPTNINNVCCMVFFGDIRSQFVLSSMIMKRIREELKGSKYFILCSWPGLESMFPYVDEYWQPSNDSLLKDMYLKSQSFENTSAEVISITRLLNSYLPEDILDQSIYTDYYNRGFTKEFFNRFGHIKVFLPSVPSSTVLGQDFNRKLVSKSKKVLIYPATHIQNYKNDKIEYNLVSIEFWKELINCLSENNYSPVIYQDYLTYDLSVDYFDKHLFYKSENVSDLLSLFRSNDIVLDVFTGISKFAIAARCPFVCCQDRNIFNFYKEYETDDLTSKNLPKEYIFTFPEVCDLSSKTVWKRSLFDVIINKLVCMGDIDKQDLPSPVEINKSVLYDTVRKIKANKLGTKFIKVPKC
jgi:hypothetical protein